MGVELVALAVRKVSSWLVAQMVLGTALLLERNGQPTNRSWMECWMFVSVRCGGACEEEKRSHALAQACMTGLRCRVIP